MSEKIIAAPTTQFVKVDGATMSDAIFQMPNMLIKRTLHVDWSKVTQERWDMVLDALEEIRANAAANWQLFEPWSELLINREASDDSVSPAALFCF